MQRARRPSAPLRLAAYTAALALGLAAQPAAADEPEARGETTTYTFEDDLVSGDTVQPGLEVLHVRRRGDRSSLVRARTAFIVELLESAERL